MSQGNFFCTFIITLQFLAVSCLELKNQNFTSNAQDDGQRAPQENAENDNDSENNEEPNQSTQNENPEIEPVNPLLPSISFDNSLSSNLETSSPILIPVSLNTSSTLAVTVEYEVTNGTAIGSGDDYFLPKGTLIFNPNEVQKNLSLIITNDTKAESDETVIITLKNATNADVGTIFEHTHVIHDNDTRIWLGTNTISPSDSMNSAGNWSGLTYQPASVTGTGILWGVRNGPSELSALVYNNQTQKWDQSSLITLRYPNNTGIPDAEGVTKADWDENFIYVAAERDGIGASRLSILRYATNGTGQATHEWNLTHSVSNIETVEMNVDNNAGWEALTWVSDSFLIANGFYDSRLSKTYSPADYPNHGSGLFFAGLEGNGKIYIYALDHMNTSQFYKIGSFSAGLNNTIMGLEFDRDLGSLWAHCDNTCDNKSNVFVIDTHTPSTNYGHFIIQRSFDKPFGMSVITEAQNLEAIAIFPEEECSNNLKKIFWLNDSGTAQRNLWSELIPCGPLAPPL